MHTYINLQLNNAFLTKYVWTFVITKDVPGIKMSNNRKKKMWKILFFSTKVNFEQFHVFKSTEF